MNTRDWALAYASLGWRVFPVVRGQKRPLYKGWQRDATSDPGLIARYWRREPGPNIGVVCGDVFDAFDIEADHLKALRRWMTSRGLLFPETPLARTGRGGIHLLVSPTGIGRGRDLHLDGAHLGELKSSGGFIVVAPSVTAGPYRWLRPPAQYPLAPATAWMGELAAPTPTRTTLANGGHGRIGTRRDLDALAAAITGAGTGRRNNILYWAMRRATEEHIPAAMATAVLGRAAIKAGLAEHEVTATIRSANEGSSR